MKRRGHRKSRQGCQECKRRHIKCDEGRPQCANCTITSRRCDFGERRSSRTRHGSAPATLTEPPAAFSHPQLPRRTQALSVADESPVVVVPQGGHDDAAAGPVVNLHHMELMAHYTFAVSNPEIDPDLDRAATKMVVQTALEFPWLLYEILAISSRHLATFAPSGSGSGPRSAAFYRAQASQLQTQALHLFNRRGGGGQGQGDGSNIDGEIPLAAINETNCVAAVLFSSTLGRHLLADTLEDLQRPDDDSNSEAALDRYGRYLQVHLGLRAVASSSWSHLMESDLWPLIALAGRIHPSRSAVRGTELRGLSRWVEETMGANNNDNDDDDEEEEEECCKACLEAIDLLQIGLDESSSSSSSSSAFLLPPLSQQHQPHQQHQMTFTWPVRCPAKFGELIRRRSPPALVVLAHYAVLLHRGRHLWQIGPSAPRFLHVISDVLGGSGPGGDKDTRPSSRGRGRSCGEGRQRHNAHSVSARMGWDGMGWDGMGWDGLGYGNIR
ncbi:hypothetical protein PG984_015128 [Apiospora sp. TS-2023a]